MCAQRNEEIVNKLLVLASATVFSLPLSAWAGDAKAVDLSNLIVIRTAESSDKVTTEQAPEILIMNVDQIPMGADGKVDVEALGTSCSGLEASAQSIVLRPIPAKVFEMFQTANGGGALASLASAPDFRSRGNWNFFYDFGSDRFFFGYGQPGYYHYGYDQPYYPHYGYYYGDNFYNYQPYGHRYWGGHRYSYYGRP
jgi:hypothetical protein